MIVMLALDVRDKLAELGRASTDNSDWVMMQVDAAYGCSRWLPN